MIVDRTPQQNAAVDYQRPGLSFGAGRYNGYNPLFAGNQPAVGRAADWNWLSVHFSPFQSSLQSGAAINSSGQTLQNVRIFGLALPDQPQGQILFPNAINEVTSSPSLFWDNTQLLLEVPHNQFGTFPTNPVNSGLPNGNDFARMGEGRALGNPTGTITTVSSAGGLTGTYKYAYVEYDVDGNQTGLSPQTTVVAASNQYQLTVPLPRAGVSHRAIVRTKANGSTFFLLHDFKAGNQELCTIFQDNVADGSLGAAIVDADSTLMYKMVLNQNSDWGSIFMCTHPDQAGFGIDLTVYTADVTTQNYCANFHGTVANQVVQSMAYYSLVTGTDSNTGHFRADWVPTDDAGQNPSIVFIMKPHGEFVHTPYTTGVTNPTWYGLTGGVAGNYIVGRIDSSHSQAGLYMGASSEPYFGSNINYSTGDTYSAGTCGPWRIGNAAASTTIPFKLEVAPVGASGTAITWTEVLRINAAGTSVGFGGANIGVNGFNVCLSAASSCGFTYNVTGGAVDTKNWDFNFSSSLGAFRLVNDAVNTATVWLQCSRSAMNVTAVNFPNGNVTIGTAALATNATSGFLHDQSCAGTPTGTPTTVTGRIPQIVDSTNNIPYFYNSFWRSHVGQEQANGQQIVWKSVTELTTIAAAATTDTAISIPANAVVLAVTVRVTTVIPTAATFTVTGTSSGTQFDVAGGVSTAANTTDVGTRNCPYSNGASQTIRITPNLNPAANSGRVRVTIHYYLPTPPTS